MVSWTLGPATRDWQYQYWNFQEEETSLLYSLRWRPKLWGTLSEKWKQTNKKIQFLLGYHVYFTFTLSNIEWFFVWECLGTLISLGPILHERSEELKDPDYSLATWWETICITIKQKPVQGKEQHQETYKSWVKTDIEGKRDLCDGKKSDLGP